MKQKKVPMRKCTGCGEMKEKRELIRVVKAPDVIDSDGNIAAYGEISLDLTGKKPGRGADLSVHSAVKFPMNYMNKWKESFSL